MFSMFHIRIGMFSMFTVRAQFDRTLTLHDDTNTVKADRNTKIALAASRRMPVPMVKYSGDLVITGSLKTGFTVRGASRSACLYELRRQILHEFEDLLRHDLTD